MKQFIKRILSNHYLLKLSKGNRFIFVFHDVSNPGSAQYSTHYSTPIETFREQVHLIHSLFEIIPLEDIVTNKQLSENRNYAAITFDDGFHSVLEHADPILSNHNIPYTVFLNGSAVEHNQIWVSNVELLKDQSYNDELLRLTKTKLKPNEDPVNAIVNRGKFTHELSLKYLLKDAGTKIYLDKDDIAFLLNKNVRIENHSYDHFVMRSTDAEERKRQIDSNHQLLHHLTGKDSHHFAIPFGKKEHFDEACIAELRAGYYPFIYTSNPNRFRTKDLDNPEFLIPRIGLTTETSRQLLFYINRALLKTYDL